MDNTASLAHSAQCLKKAIPLMVKYKMPVTPINYAIWYCYVQGDNPQLNTELDKVIGQHNTCSAQSAQEIFDKYIVIHSTPIWILAEFGILGFTSMMIFLFILTIGFIYEWKKGALDWE